MTWIVIGASSGVGRALAEAIAARKEDLVVVARDERDLDALARDLHTRYGVEAHVCVADATNPQEFAAELVRAAPPEGVVEGLLFPLGAVRDDDTIDLLPGGADALVDINFRSVVAVVREYLPVMLARRRGVIVGFGSIATARGRSSNVLYSASKVALRSFFESLRHACHARGVVVQFYILGYIDTSLAYGRRLLLPKATPAWVAERVVRNLYSGGGVWFLPWFWKPVVTVLRMLPWSLFSRLRF